MLLFTEQLYIPAILPLTRNLFSKIEFCVSSIIWLVSCSLSFTGDPSSVHLTVVAGPCSVLQEMVNSGEFALGSVCKLNFIRTKSASASVFQGLASFMHLYRTVMTYHVNGD